MAQLHLVIGPVGAGKSTFAIQLAQELGAVRLTLDDWMATLYGDDERPPTGRVPWYRARAARCLHQLWETTRQVLRAGTHVVLEPGLVTRHERASFYGWVDGEAFELVVHVLDADREVRWARVERRNAEQGETFAMEVPREIFDLASDMWQEPDVLERQERDVRDVR